MEHAVLLQHSATDTGSTASSMSVVSIAAVPTSVGSATTATATATTTATTKTNTKNHSYSKLSARSLLGGRTSLPRVMTDFSERRLVRRISMTLGEDSDTSNHDDFMHEETAATASNLSRKKTAAPAPLHRKELVVGKMLGQGSFSQVMEVRKFIWKKDQLYLNTEERKARQRLERGSFAVKHLNRTLLRRPKEFYQAALELAREAEYMTRLCHPHLLKARAISYGGTAALESGRYNDFFIVSDRLVDTLDERIQKWQRSFSPALPIKLQYALQLGSALHYLHSKRLVFRDVKSSNCGFLANGKLQLFDFGFCRSLPQAPTSTDTDEMQEQGLHNQEETFHISMAGTFRYMAPEMMLGHAYGCQADVYAWSLVLWELLAEQKVYANIKLHHQFVRRVGELEQRPELTTIENSDLQHILSHAWDANLRIRWNMAQCLTAMLPVYEALEPNHNKTNTTNKSITKGLRRAKTTATAAATAAIQSNSRATIKAHGRTQSLPTLKTAAATTTSSYNALPSSPSRRRENGAIVEC